MPSGPRIRANNVYGTVSDNPLLMAAVSFTSLGLSLLPAVSGQHAVVVLDPKRVYGEPEIVVVTSHLAMGTTATITRGQYGTTARDHPQTTAWAHVPIDEDYIEILTSSTRPSDPYRGQIIFETDTGRWSARSITDTWLPSPHNPPSVRLTHSVNQAIADGTAGTIVTWDTETYDTDSMHSGANPTRITFTTAGLYLVVFSGVVDVGSDYAYAVPLIRRNGTQFVGYGTTMGTNTAAGTNGVVINATMLYKFAAAEYIEVLVIQDNTANVSRNLLTGSATNDRPNFAATWIGVG